MRQRPSGVTLSDALKTKALDLPVEPVECELVDSEFRLLSSCSHFPNPCLFF